MGGKRILTANKARFLRVYLTKLYEAASYVESGLTESLACERSGIYREHYYSFSKLSKNALGEDVLLNRNETIVVFYDWGKRYRLIKMYAQRMDAVARHIQAQTGESLTKLYEMYGVNKQHIKQVLEFASKGYTGERSCEYLLYTRIFGDGEVPANFLNLLIGYMQRLSPRQREILKMRTGVSSNLYSVSEVSRYFNLTNSLVNKIENWCIEHIRGFAERDKQQKTDGNNSSKSIQSLGLSQRAVTSLLIAGYDTVDKLNGVKKRDLMAVRYLGMKCCDEVVSKLLSLPYTEVRVLKPEGHSELVKVKDYSEVTPDMIITFNYNDEIFQELYRI